LQPPEKVAKKEVVMNKKNIPTELQRCNVCGEWKGTLNGQEITCLCEGPLCQRCGKNRLHRPVSYYWDEEREQAIHVPWCVGFSLLCDECRLEEYQNEFLGLAVRGAIVGDIIGSAFEGQRVGTQDFRLFSGNSRFTDDTVLTLAIAEAILTGEDYGTMLKRYGRLYPYAGYGRHFGMWLWSNDMIPYNSFGNGSAMRVSSIGVAFNNKKEVLREAKRTAEVTHNHPEGIKGAQAVALAVHMASRRHDKESIKNEIENTFGYDLSRSFEDLGPEAGFTVSCQETVPLAMIAFLASKDYEDAVRKAVSLGGDTDTLACITGSVAGAFYRKIPDSFIRQSIVRLTPELLRVVDDFEFTYTFKQE
jgi:ADP-ribosylglycohydrolase